VSEVLGHKEVGITLDRYSHALPTLHTQAMARLDAMLGRRDATRGAAVRAAIRAPRWSQKRIRAPLRAP